MYLLHAPGRSRSVSAAAVPMLLAVGLVASPAVAQGPVLTIDPAGPFPAGSQTLTVSGSGFDPKAADGAGIYLAFGPITPAPRYYTDAGVYETFKWISLGGPDSPATAPMAADGSFRTDLQVSSAFTSGAGSVDCVVTTCALLAFAAHGSPDRSQDACVVMTFQGAAASGMPAGGTDTPAGSATPTASPATAAGASGQPQGSSAPGPCAVLTSSP